MKPAHLVSARSLVLCAFAAALMAAPAAAQHSNPGTGPAETAVPRDEAPAPAATPAPAPAEPKETPSTERPSTATGRSGSGGTSSSGRSGRTDGDTPGSRPRNGQP